MTQFKRSRGILKTEPLAETRLPITQDADANRGALVLGADGQIRASIKSEPTSSYGWRLLRTEISVEPVVNIYIDAAAPSITDEEVLDSQPTVLSQPINNFRQAALFANKAILGENQTAEVFVKPGLYDPVSSWNCAVTLLAVDASWNVQYPSDFMGGPSTPNNSFPVLASGYGNLSTSVNFVPWKVAFRSSAPGDPEFSILSYGNGLDFGNSFEVYGGFNFLSVADTIRLIREQNNGTLPSYASWLTPSWFVTNQPFGNNPMPVVPNISAFTTNLTTNLDTFLSAFRTANSKSGAYSGFIQNGGAISYSGSKASVRYLQDCVFGAAFPGRNYSTGNVRDSYITKLDDSPCVLEIANIGIRGNSTITSAGMGVTGPLLYADSLFHGTAAVSTPWTWTQHCSSLIGSGNNASSLTIDTGQASWYIQGASVSHGQDATGKWLPNSIFLLDNSGSIATSSNGPFIDAFLTTKELTVQDAAFRYGGSGTPQFTPPITNRNGGFVGAFGPNGYNSTKTRIAVLGMRNAGGSAAREKGISILPGTTDPFVTSATGGARAFDSVNSVVVGEGFPAPGGGGNVVITTDTSGCGLNCGVRDYLGGINATQGNILSPDGTVL